jgi:hypothetical protein
MRAGGWMNAQETAGTLIKAAEAILDAEKELLALEDRRRELLLELQLAEAALLTQADGPINGKNAEIRAAQLLHETAPERIQINEYEREIARKRCELNFRQNMFKSHQAILALFAARPDITKI